MTNGFFMFLVETIDFFFRMTFYGCPYDDYQKGIDFGMCTLACVYTPFPSSTVSFS